MAPVESPPCPWACSCLSSQFAEWCLDYGAHGCRVPDRPYSLFEGEGNSRRWVRGPDPPARVAGTRAFDLAGGVTPRLYMITSRVVRCRARVVLLRLSSECVWASWGELAGRTWRVCCVVTEER